MIKRFIISFLFFSALLYAKSIDLQNSKKLYVGFEINPLSILALGDTTFYFSTGISIFNPNNNTEIAFPILWTKEDRSINYYQNKRNIVRHYQESFLYVDTRYRKYLRSLEDGIYFDAFMRFCSIKGKLRNEDVIQRTDKLGIGAGVGYRFLPKKSPNFYYGFSFAIGRYLTENNDIYDDMFFINDHAYFIDIEFFKFGYLFSL